MTACFNPINLKNSIRKNVSYRYIPNISIVCNINKNKIYDIIKFTFLDISELTVFGYNNYSEEFWGKKIIKNSYLLHFTIKIQSYGYEESALIISPLVGDDNEINMIVKSIHEMVELYQSSSFVKSCIDNL
jgi:hypothetical protein